MFDPRGIGSHVATVHKRVMTRIFAPPPTVEAPPPIVEPKVEAPPIVEPKPPAPSRKGFFDTWTDDLDRWHGKKP